MAEVAAKTLTGSLMSYLTYKQTLQAEIKQIQQDIKDETEEYRKDLKNARAKLKIVDYEIGKLTDDSLKYVRAGKTMEVNLTLDDFTPSQDNIDLESAAKEMKAAQQAAKKGSK